MRKIIISFLVILTLICSCSNKNEKAADWVHQADKLWDGQKYTNSEKAIECLGRAIELLQTNAELYNKRGNAYYTIGQYDLAVDDFSRAVNMAPKYADAYNNRAAAYIRLGEYQRAVENYNEAIRLNPHHAVFFNNRGVVYLLQHQKESGCRDVQKACALGDCVTMAEAKIKAYCF